MPATNDALKDRLSRYREIKITRDRQKVRTHHLKPGLVRIGGRQALPAAGAGVGYTVVQERAQEPVDSDHARGGAEADFQAVPITDAKQVASVVEKFRHKYGASDVKKYYSKFDVAVLVADALIARKMLLPATFERDRSESHVSVFVESIVRGAGWPDRCAGRGSRGRRRRASR